MSCSVLQCVAVCCTFAFGSYRLLAAHVVNCSELKRVAVCCTVLQSVARVPPWLVRVVGCACCVLQCVAVCCSVLQCVAACCNMLGVNCSMFLCVAVCGRMLYVCHPGSYGLLAMSVCVAVWRSVVQ